MSRCWLEGEWRAYLDKELPAADLEAGRRHLAECRNCSVLVQELGRRAARVSALMGALDYIPEARPALVRASRGWRWKHWVVPAALAAALAGLVVAWPRRQPVVHVPRPAVVAVAPPDQTAPSGRGSVINVRTHMGAATVRERSPQPEYYLALDDEPIESGVVVQVTLPDSGLLAEVIYDDYGRPRAVRPLN